MSDISREIISWFFSETTCTLRYVIFYREGNEQNFDRLEALPKQ
jgi:hypothetical protein